MNIVKFTFIRVKDGSGQDRDATKAYYYNNGTHNKLRYVYVKDNTGVGHAIDVYTANYDHGDND